MSAIFGIYHYDSKPVDPAQIVEMADILSHRGRDGVGVWTNAAVGLGHRMLWTTPESLHEKLPKNYYNDLTITADARLDNRDELIKVLKIKQNCNEVITDSALILSAYEKWGEACPERLLGDFTFAIWDKNKHSLFCARDHFGIKPFYYFASGRQFAFATEIKALLALNEVSHKVNEEMIADYLIYNFENKSATFYKDLLRLPPAHSITITPSGIRLHCYFSLNLNSEHSSRSNEEYAEGLREIFTEAVRCRMRSAFAIGSKLSGGLDSSSISCVARDILRQNNGGDLPTFSLIYNRIKECDEQEFINCTLSQGGFNPHFIAGDEHLPLRNLKSISWHTDAPSIGPGASSSWELNKAISESGVRVIFDGHDGDSAISYGYKFLDELAQAGRWLTLAREAHHLAPVFSMSQQKIIRAYFYQYSWKPFLRKHPTLRRIKKFSQKFTRRKKQKSWDENINALRNRLINKDFAEKVKLEDRYNSLIFNSPLVARTAREEHYLSVTATAQCLALEQLDALSATFNLETRYPFWDKRLIEYSLSLPGEQKYNDGWNRVVMRRAMKNILPDEVCWRRKKTDFTANIVDGLINHEKFLLGQLILDNRNIDMFFDRNAVSQAYSQLSSQNIDSNEMKTRAEVRTLLSIGSFSSWLQFTAN